MSERQIDEAIDDAVRDLMNVDADAAFRARVVERLRQPKSHGHFWRQLSLACAAAAVIVTGVVLMRAPEKPFVGQRPAPAATAVTRPPAAEPVAAAPTAPVVARPTASAARRRPSDPTHAISRGALVATVVDSAPGTWLPEGIEPMGHITPIELTPISTAPIVMTEITITPLAAPSELVIVPLTRIDRD
jgi:hypothetical protein